MNARILYVLSTASLLCLLTACGGGGGGGGGGAGGAGTPPPGGGNPPPAGPPDLTVEAAFPDLSFSQPVSLKQAPGDGSRWYAVEKGGVVRVFDNDPAADSSAVFLDIAARVDSSFNEAGLLGLAFHPGFPSTPEVFLSYTADGSPLTSRISRFRLDNTGQALDPATEEILVEIAQPQSNHNGGDLAFGPAGRLYASFGDGGGGGDPGENAQDTGNLLGTILRIDVDAGGSYEIPGDNPFAGGPRCGRGEAGGACAEIYAWGLRNPWRMSFDTGTGCLWTGDVGQGAWEEIDRIERGGNYGWNDREGAHCFDPPSSCALGFDEPVTEYDHSQGASVTGGYVYRGSAIAGLDGWYVFGDFLSGTLFAVAADSQPTVDPEVVGQSGLLISTFARDNDGELYAIDYGSGTVHRIVAE